MKKENKRLDQLVSRLDPTLVKDATLGNTLNTEHLLEQVTERYLMLLNKHPDPNVSIGTDNVSADSSSVFDLTNHFDPLTKLPNRSSFSQHVEQAIHRSKRHKRPFALIFIDIDHFKGINDAHGHQTGDYILRQLADRISFSIRHSDILCRLAGDEFCLLVEELDDRDSILCIIESVREAISAPMHFDEFTISLTVSMGVSIFPDDGTSFQDLLHYADLAMYEAKRNGRDSVSVFTPKISQQMQILNRQHKQLKESLENNSFDYYYQPELSIKTGDVSAVRQIGKLHCADLDSEQDIVLAATRSKLLSSVNLELIQHGCKTLKQWKNNYPHSPRIVVPLYKSLLCSAHCSSLVEKIIRNSHIDPELLELEIDESELSHQCNYGPSNLLKLHQLGCKISLLNYGIGPASFQLLSSGHIDKIKINGALINELEVNRQSYTLMEAIIDLCKRFDIQSIALDISSPRQIKLLEKLNCVGIQGDFISQPMIKTDIECILNHYNNQVQLGLDFWEIEKSANQ